MSHRAPDLGGWCHARLRKGDADWRFWVGYFLAQFGLRSLKGAGRTGSPATMKGSKGKRGRGGIDSWRNIADNGVWLCTAHITLALLAASLYFLPPATPRRWAPRQPRRARVASVRRPFPRWGIAIARAITYAAMDYFPMSLEWEDQPSFVEASVKGVPSIIGCEPTECLPLSIKLRGITATTGRDAVSSENKGAGHLNNILHIPLLRQLWSWLPSLDPISRAHMRALLERGRSVLMIPGGVAECLRMTPKCETVYLRKRFGFVKMAIQTGAQLVPAYSFGQTRTYSYWKLGPPLCSDATTARLAKIIGLAPMAFWGRCGSPMPRRGEDTHSGG